MTLLPGLSDCHVHVVFSGALGVLDRVQQPFSYQFYEAATNLERTLALGITTVRDAGGADLGIKRAVDNGLITGPRMQLSITAMSQTGRARRPATMYVSGLIMRRCSPSL